MAGTQWQECWPAACPSFSACSKQACWLPCPLLSLEKKLIYTRRQLLCDCRDAKALQEKAAKKAAEGEKKK